MAIKFIQQLKVVHRRCDLQQLLVGRKLTVKVRAVPVSINNQDSQYLSVDKSLLSGSVNLEYF